LFGDIGIACSRLEKENYSVAGGVKPILNFFREAGETIFDCIESNFKITVVLIVVIVH